MRTAVPGAAKEMGKKLSALAIALLFSACGAGQPPADTDAETATNSGAAPDQASVPAVIGEAPPMNGAWVIFSGGEAEADTVVAEVAATPEERERGLMHRDELLEGAGMLFVFEDSQERSFWMANTYIPLDIAYMDADFAIVSILAMRPLDTNLYPSGAPAMYALEVPQGWFATHGIEVGDRAEVVFGPTLGG